MMQTLQQLQSGKLKGLKELKLACNLTEFPKEIIDLSDTLEVLDLSNNLLSELPDDFSKLKKLRIAFFSNNLFTILPTILYDCPRLTMIGFKSNQIKTIPEKSLPITTRWLILTNNQIEKIPDSIGDCDKLQKVAFAGNKIKALPESMSNCKKLELLRISANQLNEIPDWLLHLPRLSWLAFSGNPCSFKSVFSEELTEIHWSTLQLNKILGEGASGVISKATLTNKSLQKAEVAVKIFKGEVTSDGYPQDEMKTFIAAGKHQNLVPLKGKVIGHEEFKEGLVLELIPPNYKVLGNPPSMDSCTRDVYHPDLQFTIAQTLSILIGVASAVKHLHDKGVLHGDLYAHNTLVNEDAHAYFGDFGAATFYDKKNKSNAELLERIEVRAFGCLMEDLIERVIVEPKYLKVSTSLTDLKESCLIEDVLKRKKFEQIHFFLEEFSTFISK